MIFEGLTRNVSNGVEMGIAERVDVSEDQKIYTFHLRKSYWNDGSLVTATDFERSWKKHLEPGFPSLCPYLFYSIKNAESARNGLVGLEEVGIKAKNKDTLIVELSRPNPCFLSLTAYPAFLPVPSQHENQFENILKSDSIITNGPFQIERIKANTEIVLKKNNRFWNASEIHLDAIHIAMISNGVTAWKMFEQGELDWIGGAVSPIVTDCYSKSDRYCIQYIPTNATTFCAFHTEHPYLSNIHLRHALSLSINRDAITHQITQKNEISATRLIPPSLMGFRNKILYQPFDPELAKLHFQKAIKELDILPKDLNNLILSYASSEIQHQIAQSIQQQWKETLGITVQLHQCERNIFIERLQHHDYQIALHYWIAQYNDPINIVERFKDKSNPKNIPGWFHPTYNQLVQEAFQSTDPLDRMTYIEAAELVLIHDMPLAPIYHWTNTSIAQTWVKNLQCNSNGAVLFERCWISK